MILHALKLIPVFIALVTLGGWAPPVNAAVRTVETVQQDVRKVTLADNGGIATVRFERRDQGTCAWFEARFDESSKRWVYTRAGEAARRGKSAEIRDFHRRLEPNYR